MQHIYNTNKAKIFDRSISVIAGITLIGVITYYNLLGSLHSLPITEGWFSAYAQLVLQGKVIYRDFYLYLTPLYVWIIALFTFIFGNSIFALHIFGIVIILLISITLYSLLQNRFGPAEGFLGSVLAIIYLQSGNAHITYDFTQVLILFSLLSVYFLIRAQTSLNFQYGSLSKRNIKNSLLFFLSGIFCSLAFLIKQSNGSFTVVGTSLACIYLILNTKFNYKIKLNLYLIFNIGVILPILILYIYLIHVNAFEDFIQQIFINAILAKGSLTKILYAWPNNLFTYVFLVQIKTILLYLFPIFIISYYIKNYLNIDLFGIFKINKSIFEHIREIGLLIIFTFLIIFIISSAWIDIPWLRSVGTREDRTFSNYIIPVSVCWAIVYSFWGALFLINKIIPAPNTIDVLLAITTIGMIAGNGTSAGLSEISVFIALGWMIAFLCNKNQVPFFGALLAIWISFYLLVPYVYLKFDRPYAWWGVTEPNTRTALVEIDSIHMFKGIYVSQRTKNNFELIDRALTQSPQSGEVFSFPNIPIIYLLTNRWPNSKVLITWFDFLNDEDSIAEANRLKQAHPSVLVVLRLPEEAYHAHEQLFRAGKRDILEEIDNLVSKENGEYERALSLEISKDSILEVFYRNADK